jgi:1-acyl-sn-glycerol-3-phosphate acyltransferase
MAKDSLFKNPVFGFILRGCGAFSVKRGRIDAKALKEALFYLEKGEPLLIFPQGTRRKASEERKVNPGLGFLAVKSGVPVVPVRLIGTDKVLPKGAKWIKRHPVTIVFGKPDCFGADDDYQQVSLQTLDRILALNPS